MTREFALIATLLLPSFTLSSCTVSTRGVETPSSRTDEMVRFEGTVAHGDRLPTPQQQLEQVAVITLDTSNAKIRVVLAPTWYLEQHGFEIEQDTPLAVTGREVEENGERRVLATEVERGSQKLQLRDEAGKPLWKGEQPQQPSEPPTEQPEPSGTGAK